MTKRVSLRKLSFALLAQLMPFHPRAPPSKVFRAFLIKNNHKQDLLQSSLPIANPAKTAQKQQKKVAKKLGSIVNQIKRNHKHDQSKASEPDLVNDQSRELIKKREQYYKPKNINKLVKKIQKSHNIDQGLTFKNGLSIQNNIISLAPTNAVHHQATIQPNQMIMYANSNDNRQSSGTIEQPIIIIDKTSGISSTREQQMSKDLTIIPFNNLAPKTKNKKSQQQKIPSVIKPKNDLLKKALLGRIEKNKNK